MCPSSEVPQPASPLPGALTLTDVPFHPLNRAHHVQRHPPPLSKSLDHVFSHSECPLLFLALFHANSLLTKYFSRQPELLLYEQPASPCKGHTNCSLVGPLCRKEQWEGQSLKKPQPVSNYFAPNAPTHTHTHTDGPSFHPSPPTTTSSDLRHLLQEAFPGPA